MKYTPQVQRQRRPLPEYGKGTGSQELRDFFVPRLAECQPVPQADLPIIHLPTAKLDDEV